MHKNIKSVRNIFIRANLIKNQLILLINKNHHKNRITSYISLKLKNLINFNNDEPNREKT